MLQRGALILRRLYFIKSSYFFEMQFQELPSRKRARSARRLESLNWEEKAVAPPNASPTPSSNQKGSDIETSANNLLAHIPGEASGFYLMAVGALSNPSMQVMWLLFVLSLVITLLLGWAKKSSPAVIGSTIIAFLIWMTAMDQGVFRIAYRDLFSPPIGLLIAAFYSIVLTALADRGFLK